MAQRTKKRVTGEEFQKAYVLACKAGKTKEELAEQLGLDKPAVTSKISAFKTGILEQAAKTPGSKLTEDNFPKLKKSPHAAKTDPAEKFNSFLSLLDENEIELTESESDDSDESDIADEVDADETSSV